MPAPINLPWHLSDIKDSSYQEVAEWNCLEGMVVRLVKKLVGSMRQVSPMSRPTTKSTVKTNIISGLVRQFLISRFKESKEFKEARDARLNKEMLAGQISTLSKPFQEVVGDLFQMMDLVGRMAVNGRFFLGGSQNSSTPATLATSMRSSEFSSKVGSKQMKEKHFSHPKFIYQYFNHLRSDDREQMKAVLLKDYRVLETVDLFLGGSNYLLMTPKEVLAPAIKREADQIILIHNHPSGQASPSERDFQFTRQIQSLSEQLGIELIDHVIIGDGYYSFCEEGIL